MLDFFPLKKGYDFYLQLTKEILLGLRSDKSQVELSQLLGYSFNQVGKWEAGVTLFHWDDFIQMSEAVNIPWRKHFSEVFVFNNNQTLENKNAFEILRQFFGHASMNEVAQHMHKSKSTISRLKNDQVKADFADILKLMDQRPFVLSSWVSRFLDIQKLTSIRDQHEREMKVLQGLLQVPFAPSVNAALQMEKPEDENYVSWLARKTGLNGPQVQQALQILLESRVIEKRGDQYFSILRDLTFMRNPEFRRYTQFLSSQIAQNFGMKSRIPNYNNPSLASTRTHAMSSEAARKISEALVLFHHQVADIIKSDKAKADHVRTIVIHSVDLELLAPKSTN